MTTSNDPWASLLRPTDEGTVSARRVDTSSPWDFFWAHGHGGECMLILKHLTPSHILSLPKLRGIRVEERGGEGRSILAFRLCDIQHKDLFYRLCLDIVAAASASETEADVLKKAVARTWRWHHLLRGGSDERLSPEEQKGLMGELIVLERYLIPALGNSGAVESWHGPLGAPRDFELGKVAFEAKAVRNGAGAKLTVNTDEQLDPEGLEALYLHVLQVEKDTSGAMTGLTLTGLAARIRDAIEFSNPSALSHFERLLSAAGFEWAHDYSDSRWIECSSSFYEVKDDFPRINPLNVPQGVNNLSYCIGLKACTEYEVSWVVVADRLKGLVK